MAGELLGYVAARRQPASTVLIVDRPPLTIVIGTGEGWPYNRDPPGSIRSVPKPPVPRSLLLMAVRRPSRCATRSAGRPLDQDGRAIGLLALARALREARGEVVALTEDHAIPRPGWVPAIIRAHADHPEAAAIGGAIENGSTESSLDWASYFSTRAGIWHRSATRRCA